MAEMAARGLSAQAVLALAALGVAMGCALGCGRSEIFPRYDVPADDAGIGKDGGTDAGDAGDGGPNLDGGPGDGGCSVAVNPSSLDFGTVPFHDAATKQVIVTNLGGDSCVVSQIALGAPTDALFSLSGSQPTPFPLLAGETATIAVTFEANSVAPPLQHTGSLTLATSDAMHPSLIVPLSATVRVGCVVGFQPPSLDLGTVTFNLSASGEVKLSNIGDAPCEISQLALGLGSDPLFSLPAAQPTAFTMAPGGSAAISVSFVAQAAVAPHQRTATLTFVSNQTVAPPNASVPLSATVNTACVDDSQWIFTLSDSGQLSQFDPVQRTFTDLGTVPCAAGNPFSMAVDMNGIAWAVYRPGKLFRFDPTATPLTCDATIFKFGQSGIELFGMEFLFEPSTGVDVLYVAGGPASEVAGGPSTLATIDISSLVLTTVGTISIGWVEPAATPDGELWGFAPAGQTDGGVATLARLDPTSGASLASFEYPSLIENGAFAMKFFQGAFWIFVGNSVFTVDHVTGALTAALTNTGHSIVGAGFARCPPP